ncbi:MAG TPA: ABC transporter permease [Mycobacteriales bacterium]|nr:ABC transporter permease [Mycobacteriales bacterium]
MSRVAQLRRAAAPVLFLLLAVAAGRLVTVVHGTSTAPWGILLGYGAVFGCGTALSSVGLVLVYRSARIINFSQASYGVNAALLFLLLTTGKGWNYWVALGVSVLATASVAFLVELLVLRKFAKAPRLVLTLITVVLVQIFAAVTILLPRAFGYSPPKNGLPYVRLPSFPARTPFDRTRFHWAGAPFNGDHVALVVATLVMVLALGLFLRKSRLGTAIRGAAENSSRVEQLGVSTGVLSSTTWVLVAVLSAVGAILATTAQGGTLQQYSQSADAAYGPLMVALTAAVIARLESLPMAFAAAFGLTVFEQGLTWSFNNDQAVLNLVRFGLILLVLLLQPTRRSRTDAASSSSWAGSEEIRAIPSVLQRLPAVQTGVRRARWVFGGLLLAYPFVVSPGQLSLGTTYVIYAIVGVSIVILTGWAGQVSLGQFALVAVGALTGAWVIGDLHLPFGLALVAGTVVSALVAVLVGLPALRLQGLYLAVTTLALATTTAGLIGSHRFLEPHLPSAVGRPQILGLDLNTNLRGYYYLCVAATALAVLTAARLRRTRTARLLIAMRDNERMAQAYGINLVRTRLIAFALSGGMAGFAGVLYVVQQRAVTAGSYGPQLSVSMFLMAVLGGLGSVYAVLAGAAYFAICATVVSGTLATLLTGGIGVLLVMLFFPAGLGAMGYSVRDAWLRRVAQRYRIYVPSLAGDRIKRGEEALVPIAAGTEREPLPERYRVPSRISEFGRSQQLAKAWRY